MTNKCYNLRNLVSEFTEDNRRIQAVAGEARFGVLAVTPLLPRCPQSTGKEPIV
jgi:hypothetical protein